MITLGNIYTYHRRYGGIVMSFYGVTDLWTYVLGALGIILLPGPNSLYVLAVASARGVKVGFQAAFGVFFGDTILLLLTAAGAASLLRAYPALFIVIKYAGAAYLSFIGLQLLWGALRSLKTPATPSANAATKEIDSAINMQDPFKRAILISLLNPKALLFLLSFFIQFIDPNYPSPAVPFLILSVIVMTFSALYLSCLILAGAKLAAHFRQRRRLSAGLSSSVGGLFMWFGAKLAGASL